MANTKYKSTGAEGWFDREENLDKLAAHGNPLKRLSSAIDFELFREELERGMLNTGKTSNAGQKPLDPVMMFKIIVIKKLYGLSDAQAQYQIIDRLSFREFLGLSSGDRVPDEKTIWKFNEELTKKGLERKLFDLFLAFLDKAGVICRSGVIVDASFVEVPRQRNHRDENEAIKNGEGGKLWQDAPRKKAQKDIDARWTKKNNQTFYGYKNHAKVDAKSKLVIDYATSSASVHDSQLMPELITPGDAPQDVYADSAYAGEPIAKDLETKGVGNKIHEKGKKNAPLTDEQKASNKEKSKIRVRVEHAFGFMTCSMGRLFERVIGARRAGGGIGLINLVYNLCRYEQIKRLKIELTPAPATSAEVITSTAAAAHAPCPAAT